MNSATTSRLSRRVFLKTAVPLAAPLFVPAAAFGANDRVTVGCIGVGNRGGSLLGNFLHLTQVVAVCDVNAGTRNATKTRIENHYAQQNGTGTYHGCAAYNDFRELVARGDIDAVSICTPDHWHVPVAIAAATGGKDVFCEKPLSLTIAEGRALCDTIRRYGRVFQHGTQRRCEGQFALACELVRNKRIGDLHTIRVSSEPSHPCPNDPPQPVPEGFDYDRWLGPAPWVPYSPRRVRIPYWYWIGDYTIGFVAGQGVHFTDVAQFGHGTDDTGPVEIEGHGAFPADGLSDTATAWHVEMSFADGVKLIYDDHRAFPMGVIFEGTEGKVHALCSGVRTDPPSLIHSVIAPDEIRLRRPRGHIADFIHCVKTRQQTAAPAETAHRATSLCHLTHIAILAGRKLRWDPVREQFIGDPDANRHLTKAMRPPWRL